MAGQLDRSQPYGVVYNDTEGRFFEQGGVYFNAAGQPWEPAPLVTAPPPEAPATGRKKAAAATQLDTQLQEQP